MEERKAYRIEINVGGTFTKAVMVDDDTHEIVGRYSTLTTHAGARGVADGVVEVFRRVLEGSQVAPETSRSWRTERPRRPTRYWRAT